MKSKIPYPCVIFSEKLPAKFVTEQKLAARIEVTCTTQIKLGLVEETVFNFPKCGRRGSVKAVNSVVS